MATVIQCAILLLALVPLSCAAWIMQSYLSKYHPCLKKSLTLKCFIIWVSFVIALLTALAITLCQLPGFRWLNRCWLLRQGHPGMRVLTFGLGILACMPINFQRPITNKAALSGILLACWGFMVDVSHELDLGLSGIICGVIVGTGVFSLAPATIPTEQESDNVRWALPVGGILGIVCMFSLDWMKRMLVVGCGRISRQEERIASGFESRINSLQERIHEERRGIDHEVQEAKNAQLGRERFVKMNMEVNSKLRELRAKIDDPNHLHELQERVNAAMASKNDVVEELKAERYSFNEFHIIAVEDPDIYEDARAGKCRLLQLLRHKAAERSRLRQDLGIPAEDEAE